MLPRETQLEGGRQASFKAEGPGTGRRQPGRSREGELGARRGAARGPRGSLPPSGGHTPNYQSVPRHSATHPGPGSSARDSPAPSLSLFQKGSEERSQRSSPCLSSRPSRALRSSRRPSVTHLRAGCSLVLQVLYLDQPDHFLNLVQVVSENHALSQHRQKTEAPPISHGDPGPPSVELMGGQVPLGAQPRRQASNWQKSHRPPGPTPSGALPRVPGLEWALLRSGRHLLASVRLAPAPPDTHRRETEGIRAAALN